LKFQKALGESVFSLSDLDSAWPNYKNVSIFIQGQKKKFKFVLQCCIPVDNDPSYMLSQSQLPGP